MRGPSCRLKSTFTISACMEVEKTFQLCPRGLHRSSTLQRATPDPSVEATPNGKPNRPPPGCAYRPSDGRVVLPLRPASPRTSGGAHKLARSSGQTLTPFLSGLQREALRYVIVDLHRIGRRTCSRSSPALEGNRDLWNGSALGPNVARLRFHCSLDGRRFPRARFDARGRRLARTRWLIGGMPGKESARCNDEYDDLGLPGLAQHGVLRGTGMLQCPPRRKPGA